MLSIIKKNYKFFITRKLNILKTILTKTCKNNKNKILYIQLYCKTLDNSFPENYSKIVIKIYFYNNMFGKYF